MAVNLTNAAHALQSAFGKCADIAQNQSRVIRRKRKFCAQTLASTFVLGLLANPRASDDDLALTASDLGVEVSGQAIDQRYTESLATFFRALFTQMLGVVVRSQDSLAEILDRFSEVNLLDSSSVQLPDSMVGEFRSCGGNGKGGLSVMKMQTELDLRSGQMKCIELDSGRSNDQGCARQEGPFLKGSLRITDLGYFAVPVFMAIEQAEAYFLSRLPHNVKIIVENKCQSLIAWLNQQASGTIDITIGLSSSHRFPCRLIAFRVPDSIANRRRAKLRANSIDKTGREPSKESLAACDWEYFVTNVPGELLSVEEAIVFYRARWQIELLFKRWKSECEIGRLDGKSDEAKMARLWARLCGALIQHWLTVASCWSQEFAWSFQKFARLLRRTIGELASNLTDIDSLVAVLEKLKKLAAARCRRTKRKAQPGTLEMLRNVELLDYILT
jgi:hypothetical protein